jgi:hypothetical protein
MKLPFLFGQTQWSGWLRPVVATLAVLALWCLSALTPQPAPNATLLLQRPVMPAAAQSGEVDIAAKLDQEAGIAAYFNAQGGITLNQVRSQFRTIELETADYLLGSVPVSGYSISHDAHVYVNKNGWVLAYYLTADPVGKIFDVNTYTGPTIPATKLQNVLAAIASAAGAPFSGVTYYDFRYPNATHMMIVGSYSTAAAGAATFQINPTSSYGYFHRSYFLGACYYYPSWDGVTLSGPYGTLTANQLSPDTFHTMTIPSGCTPNGAAFGGLILIYRVP